MSFPAGRLSRLAWLSATLASMVTSSRVAMAEDVDYLSQVKPLLARHCVGCHNVEKPRGNLRLDTAAGALAGGDLGPSVVPGNVEESELYLAVLGDGVTERMPLNRPPLSQQEAAVLKAWIEGGAKAPADEEASTVEGKHWAFEPPSRPAVPVVENRQWVQNPIDAFILASLERDGIAPNPEAARETLIRRASLDVTGLPPSSQEVAAFVADERPEAYERLVDRLLSSAAYGERWGRWWLDMARYADSNGYSIDGPREVWKYRDWVIEALNRDQPFDQFTIDQLAGDLRPQATLSQKVATGFHRNTQINMEGGIDKEQFRVESVIDRVNTTGSVWLGLTVGCAQCHDHKYDPIKQSEYYQLFAFFNNSDEPTLSVASDDEVARQEEARKKVADYLLGIEREPELLAAQEKWELALSPAERQNQSEEVRKALDEPLGRRSAEANRPAFEAFMEQAKAPVLKDHQRELARLRKQVPKLSTTLVVRERATPRETHLLEAGDFTRPGPVVSPGVPEVLPGLEAAEAMEKKPLNRLDLARWLVDPKNPLTARVTVNRLWQMYFGRGLVETDADFGTQGSPPSHPELLDWLALEFVESGWSLKAVHRRILTSATYRQSSRARADLAAIDPENRLLARQSRLRLDAELVRDSALACSGLLTTAIGGPSVHPPQPDGVMSLGQLRRDWSAATGPDRFRRGLYTYFWRATPHPLLMVFDAPDSMRTCTRRVRSNTPLQALVLLNDQAFLECAQALAARALQQEGPTTEADRVTWMFQECLGRTPGEQEKTRLTEYLASERAAYQADQAGASTLWNNDEAVDPVEGAAWVGLARVLLNLDEFITRE